MTNADVVDQSGLTEIRSGPPLDAPSIAAFSRLAHVVESASRIETPEPPRTVTVEIPVVHGRFDAFPRLRDRAIADVEEAESLYQVARREAADAWEAVRTEEQRVAQAEREENAAARELEEARQRRRTADRRVRRARVDAEAASRHCSEVSRSLQDAHLRAERR
jgi:hypothetical protein